NGGFEQYFSNSSGDSVAEAIRGLGRLSCTATLAILNEAIAELGVDSGELHDRESRARRLSFIAQEWKRVGSGTPEPFDGPTDRLQDLPERFSRAPALHWQRRTGLNLQSPDGNVSGAKRRAVQHDDED
ncbi:MAG: DUF4375 domain-containing protein, partial [Alphaproteobacteria bacterium]